MHRDEQQLLQRVFEREPGAFEALLERYQALFYSVFCAPGFGFPLDYLDDLYQSFVLRLAARDFHKLRAFEGRNACSLATFLQVVATRFALDERRKFRRHPRGLGEAGRDDDEGRWEHEDESAESPDTQSLEQERVDIFHNLLFSLDWKRISAILWVFHDVQRERIADVMATSRANIDALYKRGKEQMARLFAAEEHSNALRVPDPDVLTDRVTRALRGLLPVPTRDLREALLQPGAKRTALLGLVLVEYPRYCVTRAELAALLKQPESAVEAACLAVLADVTERVDPTLANTPSE
jgi:RNA polymerase sigma factor (sigma-70 family)